MAADRALLVRVAARVREEVANVERVVESLVDALEKFAPEPQHVVIVHGVAGLLHDFYTGIEKAFADVSPDLNGLAPGRDTWHRDLLHTMTLELPGVRPRALRPEIEQRLVEYLKFRHVYRNLYSFHLRWDRVRELVAGAVALWPDVRADLETFAAALDAVADATP